MKNTNRTDKSGFITLTSFLRFHKKLVSILDVEYEKLDKKLKWSDEEKKNKKWPNFQEKQLDFPDGSTIHINDLSVWIYNQVSPPDENYITINDIYKNENKILDILNENKNKKLSFGNQIYQIKNKLIYVKNLYDQNFVQIDRFHFHCIFLIVEHDLNFSEKDFLKLQQRYWTFENPAFLDNTKYPLPVDLKESLTEEDKDFDQETKSRVTYFGYYYSYTKHDINTYKLKILYDKAPQDNSKERATDKEFTVIEHGFHDDLENPPLYIGYAYRLEAKLHLVLDKEGKEVDKLKRDKLKITLDSGNNPIEHSAMRGSIMAISAVAGQHHIMNLESFLIKQSFLNNQSDEVKKEYLLSIKRYLFLHHYNFRINPEKINIKALEVKDVLVDKFSDSEKFSNIIGFWRIWRFDEDYNIITSILHIRDDYRTYYHTNHYKLPLYNKQVCVLEIANDGRTLCFTASPDQGSDIISYIMLKTPEYSQTITGGAMTFIGKTGGYPLKRAIVVVKENFWENLIDSNSSILKDENELRKKLIKFTNKNKNIFKKELSKTKYLNKLLRLLLQLESKKDLPSDHWIFEIT